MTGVRVRRLRVAWGLPRRLYRTFAAYEACRGRTANADRLIPFVINPLDNMMYGHSYAKCCIISTDFMF